jgi:hypothetical protein
VAVFVGECGEVVDAEVNAHGLLTGCFSDFYLDFADEV